MEIEIKQKKTNDFNPKYTEGILRRKAQRFCFTYWNPEYDADEFLIKLKTYEDVNFIVFQMELGKNWIPHYQGYIEFTKQKRYTTLLNKYISKMSYKVAKGTAEQNIVYCTKTRTQVEGTKRIWGKPRERKGQGKRTDIITFRNYIKEKPERDIRDMLNRYPIQMALYPRFYQLCKFTYYVPTENKNKKVIFCIGEPGTGKTRYALKYDKKNCWDAPIGSNNWFDGYAGQPVAVIDDYGLDGTVYKLADLLKILHGWSQKVPVKGGFTIWNPETIIITSNYHPLTWYKLNANFERETRDRWVSYQALVRRFTHVLFFIEDEEYFLPPEICRNIEAFMYDVDNMFEHQEIPLNIRKKYHSQGRGIKISELLRATEELNFDLDEDDEEESLSDSITYQSIVSRGLSAYGTDVAMNEDYSD